MRRLVLLLLSLLVGLVWWSARGGQPDEAADPPSQTPPQQTADGEELLALLDRVEVVPARPQVDGYDRDCGPGDGCVFGPDWSDATDAPLSRNGCDTRNDVLRLTLLEVRTEPGSHDCDVVAGTLLDPYTGERLDYATRGSEIHVDHLVPLAAAWDLGAWRWSPALRATFANDVRRELVATSADANLAKGDSTPASWLPPARGYRCTYLARYLEVSLHYDLPITRADATVIRHATRTC